MHKENQFSDFFRGLAWKFLKKIDLPDRGSNQHEIQGIATLKKLLGTEGRSRHRVLWRVFDDAGDTTLEMEDDLTWYNSRAGKPRAPEWRFYYKEEQPLERAMIGDLLLATQMTGGLEKRDNIDLVLYVIPQSSVLFQKVLWLLQIRRGSRPARLNATELFQRNATYLAQEVLEQLDPDLTLILAPVGKSIHEHIQIAFAEYLANPIYDEFPSTRALAEFGQHHLDIDPMADPDRSIERALELETAAFRSLEHAAVQRMLRMHKNILTDVDQFVKFSLSVQNRRKSRRGKSLEHHLAFIFRQRGLYFQEQVETEPRSTIDFIFPSKTRYAQLTAPIKTGVVALGAKSSLKDRWRQVLAEADKMRRRHLFTLETGISSAQTAEMGRNRLTLVTPASAIGSYPDPGTEIISLQSFCDYVEATT